MNKSLLFALLLMGGFLLAVLLGSIFAKKNQKVPPIVLPTIAPSPTSTPPASSFYLFVPYWSFKPHTQLSDISAMAQYQEPSTPIYFSLEEKNFQVNKTAKSWEKFLSFKKIYEGKNFLLTLRATSDTLLDSINESKTDKLLLEAIELAKNNAAKGLILDLEPKNSTPQQTSALWSSFASHCRQAQLPCSVTVFASELLGEKYKNSDFDPSLDKIFVLAYDDALITGKHGPNLALKTNDKFPNSLEKLLNAKLLPNSKTVFVLGAFGRDAVVDISRRVLGTPTPLSLQQIRGKYLQNCTTSNCVVTRDPLTAEQEIDYVDKTIYHQIYFDDEISIKNKIDFLHERDVTNFGIFAWGYY